MSTGGRIDRDEDVYFVSTTDYTLALTLFPVHGRMWRMGNSMTEWERFDTAMKAIMSVPPETAEAIRRRDPEVQVPRAGRSGAEKARKNNDSSHGQ